MKKIIRIALVILAVAFIAMQFRRPVLTGSDQITADHLFRRYAVPENIQEMLKRSCFDCHSDQTIWPWYSNIAPFSWLVSGDVEKGRKKMNFSLWGRMPVARQSSKLEDIADEVKEGKMPMKTYLLMHSDAKLSDADKAALCAWAAALSDSLDSGKE